MAPSNPSFFVTTHHSILLNLSWPLTALTSKMWQKWCYARDVSFFFGALSGHGENPSCSVGEGGTRPVSEVAILDIQPIWDFRWRQPQQHFNWTAWEMPSKNCQAEPCQLTEPEQIIISYFKPISFGVVDYTVIGNQNAFQWHIKTQLGAWSKRPRFHQLTASPKNMHSDVFIWESREEVCSSHGSNADLPTCQVSFALGWKGVA